MSRRRCSPSLTYRLRAGLRGLEHLQDGSGAEVSNKVFLDVRIHAEDVEELSATSSGFLLLAVGTDLTHYSHDFPRPVHVHVLAVRPFKVLVVIVIEHLLQRGVNIQHKVDSNVIT
jgi:hypothetical protein